MKKDIIMYFKGTSPIVVHPAKVEEMERKGWSLEKPVISKAGKSSSKEKE